MNFSQAVKSFIYNYANFSDRASRSEYWYPFLLMIGLSFVMSLVDGALFRGTPVFGSILVLAVIVPGIALSVRRMHDINRSAWWMLFGLIPIIGSIVLIYWLCQKGTVGPNQYGADPLQDKVGTTGLVQA